jgi:long-chain acyl-CoA synthetase
MMLKARAEKVRAALAGCRSIEIGSAPLASDELEEWLERARGASVFVHYGLTECSRAVILDTRRRPDKLDSVGCPAPGVELAVRDSSGRSLEAGETGQIHLRGPQLADGYWNLPDQNALRFRDGWLATGDEGRVDADGYLTFLGRKDDLITSGGYSFFPAEVETELGSVADVAQYLIAGIEDPRRILGQVPWAFVVPSDPDSWSPGDFLKLARERLPAHMVPRGIVPVPHLVLTSSGKPDRRRTVAEFAPSEDAES